jgi:xanthine dehydrogenase accessory factor
MQVWTFIESQLSQGIAVVLLYVVDSQGSSPGRQGFSMALSAAGEMQGSIGGGIMEHKWIERARQMLRQGDREVLLVRQYHDKTHLHDQSGMICSGEQVLVIMPIATEALPTVRAIVAAPAGAGIVCPGAPV